MRRGADPRRRLLRFAAPRRKAREHGADLFISVHADAVLDAA